MFSKVGEKLKQCRKEYNIKQIHFESYGFSASYISMIEKGVREAPTETIKQIYNALFLLTQGEIEKLYSLTKDVVTSKNDKLLIQVDEVEEGIDNLRKRLIDAHIERLNKGICKAESSGIFINLVSNLERLGDHLTYIAHSVIV